MSEEEIYEFLSAYEDFMKHAEVEELKHEIRTAKHSIMIDGLEVEIPDEDQLISSYEKKAAELEVTVDYYMQEFV
jgi:hypothetical protein